MNAVRLVSAVALSSLCACATPSAPPPTTTEPATASTSSTSETTTAAPLETTTAAATVPAGTWQCAHELVPPPGYLQETAFGAHATTQQAVERARAQLLARLCTPGMTDCGGLSELVTTWKTGTSVAGTQVCAMVVIEQNGLAVWKARQGLGDFDRALNDAVSSVLKDLKAPIVAVDAVVDGGVPGGERAVWLQNRLAAALGARGVTVVDLPANFTGVGLPGRATALLGARTTSRSENNERKLDIAVTARVREGKVFVRRTAPAITIVASAAPPFTTEAPPLPVDNATVTLRLQHLDVGTDRSAGLCAGDTVQLVLTSSARRHVRVIDLYGQGATAGAVVLFPNDEHTSDVVKAGETLALGGPDGFEAVPWPGNDLERFLVIAATTPAGLGALSSSTTTCRLSPTLTRKLHAGEVPSGVDVTSDGFRVLPSAQCTRRAAPTPQALQAMMASLSSLPVCP